MMISLRNRIALKTLVIVFISLVTGVNTTSIALPYDDSMGCPQDYNHTYEGYCYKFVGEASNWKSAEDACKQSNGTLLNIHDRFEQTFLTSLMSRQSGDWWIGLSNVGSLYGRYTWSNGRAAKFTNWGKEHTGNERNSCVKMQTGHVVGLWKVHVCNSTLPYICKADKVGYSTTTLPTTPAPPSCPLYWSDLGDYCYRGFYTFSKGSRKSWLEARDDCRMMGADLVSIHSQQEQTFIIDTVVSFREEVWIGLNRRDMTKDHQWSDGSKFTYSMWDDGEPDNQKGAQRCVEITGKYKWAYRNCGLAKNYICKVKKGKALITRPPTPSVTTASPCGTDWLFYGGFCFYFTKEYGRPSKLNWFAARQWCHSNGGDLASVHDDDTNDFLTNIVSKRSTEKSFWIGLNELDLDGYKWSDGSPANFFRWSKGEPNDENGGERCVDIYTMNGFWGDANCGNTRPFICKRRTDSATTATIQTPTPAPGFCENGFVGIGDRCFQVVDEEVDYNTAVSQCRRNGSKLHDLASITDKTDLATVVALLYNKTRSYWIGLNSRQGSREWRWLDNSPVSLTNWAPGQPDGAWKTPKEECAEMMAYAPDIGEWNDKACALKRGYICQHFKDGSIVTPGPTSSVCKSGFIPYGPACYLLNKNAARWRDANTYCRAQGAHLASVHNYPENSFMHILSATVSDDVWIGLSDVEVPGGRLSWSDNWPVRYTNWGEGEPSRGPSDGCVTIMRDGKWNDTACENKLPSICKITTEKPPQTPPTIKGWCPSNDWVSYEDNCYFIKPITYTRLSWGSANSQCIVKGGSLASISTKSESEFLLNQMDDIEGTKGDVWIGLLKRGKDMPYVWYDGSPLQYSNWAPDEPSDTTGSDNCVEMLKASGFWNDNRCSSRKGFICKAKKVPYTPTAAPQSTVSTVSTSPALPGTCPDKWKRIGMFCYYMRSGGLHSWGESHLHCLQQHAELVSISSDVENTFIWANLRDTYSNYWIGLIRAGGVEYRWYDGTPVTFTNWDNIRIDDKDRRESCVEIDYRTGRWSDKLCSSGMGYICKKSVDLGNVTQSTKITTRGSSSSRIPATSARTPSTTAENRLLPKYSTGKGGIGPGGVAGIVIAVLVLLVLVALVIFIVLKKGEASMLQGVQAFSRRVFSKTSEEGEVGYNNFENPTYASSSASTA